MEYVPFLKFKVNEVAAIKELPAVDKNRLHPFFDLPRKDVLNSESLKGIIDTAHRKYELHLKKLPFFYLDNFDIDDDILINGDDHYLYVLKAFSDANVVPVVGIDRSERRNEVVSEAKRDALVQLDTVAIRITDEDLISYTLIEDELNDLFDDLSDYYNKFHLIIDNRVCNNLDLNIRANQIIKFINDISEDIEFDEIILTGSSVTASIRDILEPNSETTIERFELMLFDKVQKEIDDIILGDYTAVSPNYSDVEIRGEYMRKVTAPKLMYSFDDYLHIKRGGAIETHPRGSKQYNDLSAQLTSEPFYRGAGYSFGDRYIDEKANGVGKDATPSTIPKALINAHIKFMLNDYM